MELWYQLTFDPIKALTKLSILLVLSMLAVSASVWAWKILRRNLVEHPYFKPKVIAPGFTFFFIAPWIFYFFYALGSYILGYQVWGMDWITAFWNTLEQSIRWVISASLGFAPETDNTFSRSGVILFLCFMGLMGFVILAYIPKWRYRLLFIPLTLILAVLVSYSEAPPTAFDFLLPESYASILSFRETSMAEADNLPPRFESTERAFRLFLFSVAFFGAPLVWRLKGIPRVACSVAVLSMAIVVLWPGNLVLDVPVQHDYYSEFSAEIDLMLQTFTDLVNKENLSEAESLANQIKESLTAEGRLLSPVYCEDFPGYFSGYCYVE